MTYDHSVAVTRFEALGKLVKQLSDSLDSDPIKDMPMWRNRFEHTIGLANAFADEFRQYTTFCEKKQPYLVAIRLINIIDEEIVRIGELLRRSANSIMGESPVMDALGIKPKLQFVN